ncbi:hypothetical protein [Novispirillum itersonii]|uniref:hypothetical protein n=1 Tax=Novispirillum itersonii TaxID=189 RepID=UPI0003688736|nr:hypothetical protein [Novispirillum itersonii]
MTAILPRDKQIELMVGAADRAAARIARWQKDTGVKAVLAEAPVRSASTTVVGRTDRKLAAG